MYKIYKSVRSDTPWEIYFNEGDNLPYAPIGSTAYNIDTGVIMINDGEKWVEKIGVNNNSSGGIITKQAQADWNQNNTDAPDYVKNKPFGETTTITSNTLSWDGEFSLDSDIYIVNNDIYAVHVSDSTPTQDEIIGSTITRKDSIDGTLSATITSDNCMLSDDNTVLLLNGVIFIVYKDNAVFYNITFPKAGIYFCKGEDSDSVTYTSELKSETYKFTHTDIKTINPKYLPMEEITEYVLSKINNGNEVAY